MRSSTVLSAAALTLVFLAVKSGPMQARAAVILPLILVKKHPLKHDHEHLKKLLQFVNVDAIKGLVGQLINFDAVLRHLAPSNGQMTKREPPRMMSDQPWDVPATLPPIPATPTPETDTSPSESSGCAEGSARCPTSVALPEADPGAAAAAAAHSDPDPQAEAVAPAAAQAAEDRHHGAPGQARAPTAAPPAAAPQAQAGARGPPPPRAGVPRQSPLVRGRGLRGQDAAAIPQQGLEVLGGPSAVHGAAAQVPPDGPCAHPRS
ncbi:hypothetical protein ISCGN_012947 [Ixodes scapularis]